MSYASALPWNNAVIRTWPGATREPAAMATTSFGVTSATSLPSGARLPLPSCTCVMSMVVPVFLAFQHAARPGWVSLKSRLMLMFLCSCFCAQVVVLRPLTR